MDQQLAESLARELRIAPEHIVREEYELLILERLTDGPAGKSLVLKGGTALRLAYGSPRFSDDLDFSLLAPLTEDAFAEAARAIAGTSPRLALAEALAKHATLFALYKVTEPYLAYPFSIKLEVSTRAEAWEAGQDFALQLLSSPVTPLSALANVATLERLWIEKQVALAARRQPRDLYDLWFIAQRLQRTFAPDLAGFDRRAIQRELRKYLPARHWPVLEQWSD